MVAFCQFWMEMLKTDTFCFHYVYVYVYVISSALASLYFHSCCEVQVEKSWHLKHIVIMNIIQSTNLLFCINVSGRENVTLYPSPLDGLFYHDASSTILF
jgi:hypothetical protein